MNKTVVLILMFLAVLLYSGNAIAAEEAQTDVMPSSVTVGSPEPSAPTARIDSLAPPILIPGTPEYYAKLWAESNRLKS